MPSTIYPADHAARVTEVSDHADTALAFLKLANRFEFDRCKELLQSSFDSIGTKPLAGADNGFVRACIRAYSGHHHLSIRPDDVWITILTQLSLYVNANAEAVRSHLVSHDGKKELIIMEFANRHSVPWDQMVDQFRTALEEHIKDPTLRNWIMQSFSTTTDTDRTVTAIAMMGTLRAYFKYTVILMCGIPSVTLQGTREDWVQLRDAIADVTKLPAFSGKTAEWSHLLVAVLDKFVYSFDNPSCTVTKAFWQNIAHSSLAGSGSMYWSGWITAFCFWGENGKSLRPKTTGTEKNMRPKSTSPAFSIDGHEFHRVDSSDLPPALVSVPLIVIDNGIELKARMLAGCVGYSVQESGAELEKGGKGMDTIVPEVGWWIYEENGTETKQ